MAKDPERMSFKELQEYELKVKKAKASVQERSRSELRQKLESVAADAGFKTRRARSGPRFYARRFRRRSRIVG